MPTIHPFWQRYLAVGVREDMPPGEKNKIYISRGASFFLVLLGPVFLILNLMQGYHPLAFVNLASTALGLACLLLLKSNSVNAAAFLLTGGGTVIFFVSGLIFHNGMEYTLLLGMLGAAFMFESAPARTLLAIANGAGFFAIRILHFNPPESVEFPLLRYAFNLLCFLISYYFILDIIRTVHRNHQLAIEQKNADLDRQRQQLDKEHIELIARTRELQTANQAKEKLFSIVAHDLRGPIGNLQTSLELLSSNDLKPEEFRDMVNDLKNGVDLAYGCVDTLLLWAAKQLREINPLPTDVSLDSTAKECIALLSDTAAYKNITIRNTIPAEAHVWADETQVSSILRNLVSNALKYTPAGGSVDVSAVKGDKAWQVKVADTGVGMTQEQLGRLLDESSNVSSTAGTENERGFGLGLQICKEFVQNNRGSLSIESQKGHGSSFNFTLPSTPQEIPK